MAATDSDLFAKWLEKNDRLGYIEAFSNMQATHHATFRDVQRDDLISLFQHFPPSTETVSQTQLYALFKTFAEQHFLFRAKGMICFNSIK